MKIQLERLVKSYGGRKVVNEVSLELNKKEIVGLLGPNGAGKTTTFYMIVGIVKPDSGKIFFDGQEITHSPMYKRARFGLGYLSQESSIFRRLTVKENILLIWEMRGIEKSQWAKKLDELLEEFGLKNLACQQAFTLSGGERRRVELARAFALSPSFLLLDEPFTGVDPITIEELQRLILNLKEKGVGILITDHNVRDTLKITQRAYIINEGRVLVSGNSKEVAEDPLAKKIYLGEKFVL